MSGGDPRLCHYPRCNAVVREGPFEFCPSHYRVEKAAFARGIDDRSPEIKAQFYEEQRARCNYCGNRFGVGELVWAHMRPPSQGGSNAVPNLQLTCAPCSEKKNSRTDGEFRADNKSEVPQEARTPPSPPIRSEWLRSTNFSREFNRGLN